MQGTLLALGFQILFQWNKLKIGAMVAQQPHAAALIAITHGQDPQVGGQKLVQQYPRPEHTRQLGFERSKTGRPGQHPERTLRRKGFRGQAGQPERITDDQQTHACLLWQCKPGGQAARFEDLLGAHMTGGRQTGFAEREQTRDAVQAKLGPGIWKSNAHPRRTQQARFGSFGLGQQQGLLPGLIEIRQKILGDRNLMLRHPGKTGRVREGAGSPRPQKMLHAGAQTFDQVRGLAKILDGDQT